MRAQTRDGIGDPFGLRTPYDAGQSWPQREDSHLALGVVPDGVEHWVRAASLLHSNGDAMDIATVGGQIVGVRGRVSDRINRGRLCPTDLFGWQANDSADRLSTPLIRRGGRLEETDWETAMQRIVDESRTVLGAHGPEAVGFYTSGQLFLEDYYTLTLLARAGIGTNHLDGNTRLCTATAGEALKATFGTDGQPGSYSDFDEADCFALFGHNMAETQPVLWMRVLDRLAGAEPPRLVVVDPRGTLPARRATVHLAPKPGTNLALMNALLYEVFARGYIDEDFIQRNTVGFEELRAALAGRTAEWASGICDIPAGRIQAAAEVLGTARRLVSTVLQGFYQSHQATAAAVQVNNLHLIRGMLGRPGAAVFQMNGQPTAQNTRECGADGDLPGFRNWANPAHIDQLARLWNVERSVLDHSAPPTHAMKMFKLAEQGTLKLLWISGTNPAVSLPELARIRSILAQRSLFTVVQDLYLTETACLADVVLPAATWGEKTGTFTNADRTVHLCEKAVEPPGRARADLDIFLDYARRMDFRDKDGSPLVGWTDAEGAFEAWKDCSRGRPCDYSALTYSKLREADSGIQWPCNDAAPEGTERFYTGADRWALAATAETYGKDLATGKPISAAAYREKNPLGLAMLKPAEYQPASEEPSEEFPLHVITGRTLYHFHTRTKTGRVPQLAKAAPEVWVELAAADAERRGVRQGDLVDVRTPRGRVRAKARIAELRRGVVFVPFHYGYWDTEEAYRPRDGFPGRAANELTATSWDPVSKQPQFKYSVGDVALVERDSRPAPAPTTTASAPVAPRPEAETYGGSEASVAERTETE
jgi:anaerobic selenocysteine-containing dehydrogenase